MSEMTERVARAIRDALKPNATFSDPYISDGDSGPIIDGMFDMEGIARAAIEAMREPNEAMIAAGHSTFREAAWEAPTDEEIRRAYVAMADAALKKD